VYAQDHDAYWHGINVAAIADRAAKDGVALSRTIDLTALLAELDGTLDRVVASGTKDSWVDATRVEIALARRAPAAALVAAAQYVSAVGDDRFALASTLRQLRGDFRWSLRDARELPPWAHPRGLRRAARSSG